MKKVAIIQSSYIPWKGYFDIIRSVDEFILLDNVQYSKGSWRNRNRIKTRNGLLWLSIPVSIQGKTFPNIDEVTVANNIWAEKHWKSISFEYKNAAYFKKYYNFFEEIYKIAENENHLSKINFLFIKAICKILNIKTEIRSADTYRSSGSKTTLVVSLCQAAGATQYLSGPAAQAYIEPEKFEAANIQLKYVDYSGYPEYPQLHSSFEHQVSILDLIFNTGPDALKYMKVF